MTSTRKPTIALWIPAVSPAAIDAADVAALTACIDNIVSAMG